MVLVPYFSATRKKLFKKNSIEIHFCQSLYICTVAVNFAVFATGD